MKLSVAMCTCNGERYLQEQLRSIASQTLPPAEIVICDDNSTDNTIGVIEEFRKAVSIPIALHRNPQRMGVLKNFQQAISLCKYEYIALSDQDDVWVDDKLEKQVNFLESNKKGIELVFSDVLVVNENLESSGETLWHKYQFDAEKQEQWRKGKAFLLQMKNGNVVAGHTLVFKSSYRERFMKQLSRTYLTWLHDGIIATIAGKEKKIDFIAEPLVKYRQHQNQATVPYKKITFKGDIERYQVMYDDFRQMGFTKKDLAYIGNILTHLKFRADLPASRLKRITGVIRELFSLRYWKYSRSLIMTAVRDLFNKRRQPRQ